MSGAHTVSRAASRTNTSAQRNGHHHNGVSAPPSTTSATPADSGVTDTTDLERSAPASSSHTARSTATQFQRKHQSAVNGAVTCPPSSILHAALAALILVLCVVAGYMVGQLILHPHYHISVAAPQTFLANNNAIHIAPPKIDANAKREQRAAAKAPMKTDSKTAAPAVTNDDKTLPPLLVVPKHSTTHPVPNSFPLLEERTPAWKAYDMAPSDVPPPHPVNGETMSHNEERVQYESAKQASISVSSGVGQITSITSPRGHKTLKLYLNDIGQVGYDLSAGGVVMLQQAFVDVVVQYKQCAFYTKSDSGAEVHWQEAHGSSYWRPVPKLERRWYYAEYNSVQIWCKGSQCRNCPFAVEFRVYEEGFAVRHYVAPSEEDARAVRADPQIHDAREKEFAVVQHSMRVVFSPDFYLLCWANSQEEPYERQACAQFFSPGQMTPITIQLVEQPSLAGQDRPHFKLQQRYVTILQSDGPAFLRSYGETQKDNSNALSIYTKGEAHLSPKEGMIGTAYNAHMDAVVTPTPWHVVLTGNTPGEILQNNYIVYVLCPPPPHYYPNLVDSRWVATGKSLRARQWAVEPSLAIIDWIASANYQMIHFDAGWYGFENNATETATRVHPEFAGDASNKLNLKTVGEHAKAKGIALSVYVNELALRETHDLIKIYPSWGVTGIKFGFVETLSPRAMRVLHERIVAYASVNMFVNVHDIFRPKGLTRTFPHLVTQEGIRGEERKPDALHHTILPFVRLVQGSADYTPRFLKGSGIKCTRVHQLALPFILFSPIQSLFWAEPAPAVMDGVRWYHPEQIVWTLMPTLWDDTRVLGGVIGEYASIARKAGADWFVGSISNLDAKVLQINISTLFLDLPNHPRSLIPAESRSRGYYIHMWTDMFSQVHFNANLNRNGIKVQPCVTYILPAELSSQLEVSAPTPHLPAEPQSSIDHAVAAQAFRAARYSAHIQQMIRDRKHFVQDPTTFEVLKSPIITLEMAPSGGNVMFITPITADASTITAATKS